MEYQQPKDTARSRTTNKLITHNNIEKTLIEWCETLNLDYNSVQLRLQRGWLPKRALTTPTKKPYTRPLGSIPVQKRQDLLSSQHATQSKRPQEPN